MPSNLTLLRLSLNKIEGNSVFFVPESYNKRLVDTFEGHFVIFKEEYHHQMKFDFIIITNNTQASDVSTIYTHYLRNLMNRNVFNTIINNVVNDTDVLIINNNNINGQWVKDPKNSKSRLFSWYKLTDVAHTVIEMPKLEPVEPVEPVVEPVKPVIETTEPAHEDPTPVLTGLDTIPEVPEVPNLVVPYHIGINTVGSKCNSDHNLKSPVPEPKIPVGIWAKANTEPDLLRKPLDTWEQTVIEEPHSVTEANKESDNEVTGEPTLNVSQEAEKVDAPRLDIEEFEVLCVEDAEDDVTELETPKEGLQLEENSTETTSRGYLWGWW